MNATDTLALLPLLLIAATSVVVMLGIAAKRSHGLTAALTLAGFAAAFASLWVAAPLVPRQVTSLLLIDQYALFYLGLIIASAAAVTVLSYQYFENHDERHEELYLLLLLATLGCAVLVTSIHFASFLLGLEILSISLYAMVAYFKGREEALEAGIKYLILASASAAFLLFGMALIYADTGTMEFSKIRELSLSGSSLTLLLPGIVLTLTGIGFKLGVVPFHMWTADVYQGSPAPVTAFVATTSKTAVVALLLRYLPSSVLVQYRAVFWFSRSSRLLRCAWAISSRCDNRMSSAFWPTLRSRTLDISWWRFWQAQPWRPVQWAFISWRTLSPFSRPSESSPCSPVPMAMREISRITAACSGVGR